MSGMRTLISVAIVGTIAAGCTHGNETAARRNASLYSVHQPVVQRSDFIMDLRTSGGGLAGGEAERLDAWFRTLELGYGDRISIDQSGYGTAAREDVEQVAGVHGLLVAEGAPVTAGSVPVGSVRVVVSRAAASVPSCPDWDPHKIGGNTNSTNSNYGCATNKNWAAMIADPNDLIVGRAGDGSGDATAAIKAVRAYRDRAQSGAAGTVQAESAGGN